MAWAEELRSLTSEIAHRHEDRDGSIHQLRSDIQQKTNGWKAEREKMKADLFAELRQRGKERAEEMKDFLKGIKEEHRVMAQDVAQFKADVGKMVAGFKGEREAAASAWKDLVRNKVSPQGIFPTKKETESAKTSTKQKEIQAEKVFPGTDNREKKILTIIKNNPEGATLPEIAYIMGASFVAITQHLKKLLSEGKLRKKKGKYFLREIDRLIAGTIKEECFPLREHKEKKNIERR